MTTENDIFRPYRYSITLDTNAKGWIQPSVKVLSDFLIEKEGLELHELTVMLLTNVVGELKAKGYKVATDIEDIPKNGKE